MKLASRRNTRPWKENARIAGRSYGRRRSAPQVGWRIRSRRAGRVFLPTRAQQVPRTPVSGALLAGGATALGVMGWGLVLALLSS